MLGYLKKRDNSLAMSNSRARIHLLVPSAVGIVFGLLLGVIGLMIYIQFFSCSNPPIWGPSPDQIDLTCDDEFHLQTAGLLVLLSPLIGGLVGGLIGRRFFRP